MRHLLLATALLISVPAHAAYASRTIAAEDATRDVALLRRALETVHPGLYRYTPKAGIDAAFARLQAATAKPITDLVLHGEVARMLATIHCDHTKAEMSEVLMAYRQANATHLPLRFQLIEGRMIVVSNDGQAGAPPAGSEITSINGMAVPALLLKLAPLVAYDGSTDQAIAAKLADDGDLMGDDFNENWPALFGFATSWQIGWKPLGAWRVTETELKPIGFAAWTALKGPGGKYRGEFYNSVTWRLGGKVARLQIGTFVNYRNPVQPTAFLGGFFKAMAVAGTEQLILDLRGNGGGSEDVSVALGRYLIGKPFLWSKPVRYKAVRYGDLPQFFETWGDRTARFEPPLALFEKTADGWYDRIPMARGPVTDEDTTLEQQPLAEGGFRGQLTILSGPRNGSGATRTIAQLKERAGATIIGEDSAGSAEGPTSGSIFLLKLPASGLKVRIPEAWNRTAVARFEPGRGVPVDALVVPTLADFEAGRDRALEVARAAAPAAVDATGLVEKALAGSWTGTLDYRDYRNDSRATLPTLMTSNGRTMAWTFDDGPGKTVRSSERWETAANGQTLTITADGKPETWRFAEARTAADGSLTLVLDGNTMENDRRVIARKVLTRSATGLRITKMTRVAGEPFLMRQSYDLKPIEYRP
ncbi:MAG: hypothetical protein H7267_04875 [Sandarakinorhabdus sp.]|nr:hypothetical protein [Sandarakinorhabdus sp.]